MKKFLALAVAAMTLSGCHYLGAPESYTVVDEERAPMMQPVVQPMPQPVMRPAPVMPASCGCATGTACQINPGVAGPIEITIPAQKVCIQ